jgi:hypothetical protein
MFMRRFSAMSSTGLANIAVRDKFPQTFGLEPLLGSDPKKRKRDPREKEIDDDDDVDVDEVASARRPLPGQIPCKHCGRMLAQKHMPDHIRMHEDKREFACHLCTFKSNTKGNLKKHIDRTHAKKGRRHCDICGSDFATDAKLRQHMASQHANGGTLPPPAIKFQDARNMLSSGCVASQCKFETALHSSDMVRCGKCHAHNHRECVPATASTLPDVAMVGAQFWYCEKCHNPKSPTCAVCLRQFCHKPALANHMRSKHSDAPKPKKFKCTVCGAAFTENYNLNAHNKTMH